MGLCEAVREIAEAISASKGITTSGERLVVELFRLMPLYRDIGNLNAWETALQDVFAEADDQSDVGYLLERVFAFGRYNMYADFDVDGTEGALGALRSTLSENGIPLPSATRLTSW